MSDLDPFSIDTIHRLWDELAEIPASMPETAVETLFNQVGTLIHSWHGLWLAVLRFDDAAPSDVLLGWRPRSVYFYSKLESDDRVYKQTIKRLDQGEVDESSRNHARQAGKFRASLLVDHVSEAFFQGEHYRDHYLQRGIADRLFVTLPVNEDTESYFIFDRMVNQPRFTYSDLDTASYALRSLSWLVRQLHLSYGHLVARDPLTPSERTVIRHLLRGLPEKAVARKMGHSPNTTHQHVKTLFRKFNVQSRTQLLSLWLGQQEASG